MSFNNNLIIDKNNNTLNEKSEYKKAIERLQAWYYDKKEKEAKKAKEAEEIKLKIENDKKQFFEEYDFDSEDDKLPMFYKQFRCNLIRDPANKWSRIGKDKKYNLANLNDIANYYEEICAKLQAKNEKNYKLVSN